MNTKLSDQLSAVFSENKPKTREMYTRWICRLVRFYNKQIRPSDMKQHHIDQWLAHLARPEGYSRSSTNSAKAAVKKFFNHIVNPMSVEMVSTRYRQSVVQVLTQNEITLLVNSLAPRYQLIAMELYQLSPKNEVFAKHAPTHPNVLNQKLKAAAQANSIHKSSGIKALFRAGVVHALQRGENWRQVAQKANLTESTMKKTYIPLTHC